MVLSKPLLHRLMPLALCLASAGWSSAAVTYVDPPDIIIPFTFEGIYLDIVTGDEGGSTQSGSADNDSYTVSYSEPANWDVNFFVGGAGIVHSSTFNVYREDGSDNLSAIHNALIDEVVDGGAITPGSGTGTSVPLITPSIGGSGTGDSGGLDGTPDPTHMGATAGDQFESGTVGYIAFVLDPGPSEQYGWIRVTLFDDGSTGLIHDWAYSDTPLAVGVIPEPSSLVLLVAGAMALLRRRR